MPRWTASITSSTSRRRSATSGPPSQAQTTAAPKVWDDQAGFKAAFAKFETDAAAGATVASLDGFRTAFGAATKNCGACHEVYRVKK